MQHQHKDVAWSVLSNGPLTHDRARMLSMSAQGCPWRGTMRCLVCGKTPARLCNYQCNTCPDKDVCPCGPHGGE